MYRRGESQAILESSAEKTEDKDDEVTTKELERKYFGNSASIKFRFILCDFYFQNQ